MYSQDVQWMNTTINEDHSTDKEEAEAEDPVQLNMKENKFSEEEQTDETKTNKSEKKVTFNDELELPPGEARNLGWMVNRLPSTGNIVGCTRSEYISMRENLN